MTRLRRQWKKTARRRRIARLLKSHKRAPLYLRMALSDKMKKERASV